MAANVVDLARRLERLKTDRQPHEQVWSECFDYSFPLRGSGLAGGATMSAQQGMDRLSKRLHSHASDAGRTLASALVSGATPSAAVWALLQIVGVEEGVGDVWLEEAAHELHEEIHGANYDAAAYECALDMVAAGWFVLYVDEDRTNGGLSFEQWPIASCWVAASKAGGLVDTIYRHCTLSAEQLIVEYGIENVSADVVKAFAKNPDEQIEIVRAIYPRWPHDKNAKLSKNLPFASVHWEVKTKHKLRESGYHEFPCIVPRWAVVPGTAYAVGPMFDALPEARELNDFLRMDRMNSELAVAGMWIAQDDGVLNPRTVKVGPRKIIVANSVESMKQLSAGGDWQLADTRIAQYIATIRKILMADQLQPQDGPAMTATEVHVRVNMLRQLLGPIYGRLQAEWLAPLIERVFGLLYRAGVLGEAPAELGGKGFRVRYNNPLSRAQRMDDVGAIERLNANVGQVAAAGKPEVFDLIDFDEQTRALAEALGVPAKLMRDADAVIALRDERAKQQQQAQQQAQQQQIQTMAADAALKRAA